MDLLRTVTFLTLFAVFIPKTEATTHAQQACTPVDDADNPQTADPYASDNDGCACSDLTTAPTSCYCLVGYGLIATTECTVECTNAVAGTDCVQLEDETQACPDDGITKCRCGPNFIRDSDVASDCIELTTATYQHQCDPSFDQGSGEDRTCACVEEMAAGVAQENTAYLNFKTCFCKSGWAQDPTDRRKCTQLCSAGEANCMMAEGSTDACAGTSPATDNCRCAPGYAPRIKADGSAVTCENIYCIIGEGSVEQTTFCKRLLLADGGHDYDPFYTTCKTGTGSKNGQNYCSRDCESWDPHCMNKDFTGPCLSTDEECRCAEGYGLISLNETNSLCVVTWCNLEDPNCYCPSDTAKISECRCSYWTTPDVENRGWCTSYCKPGAAACVRGDTGERCYDDYVGSAGCVCRNVPGSIFIPDNTVYTTETTTSTSSVFLGGFIPVTYDTQCKDVTTLNYCIRGTTYCTCVDAGGAIDDTSCACDVGKMLDPNNPGICISPSCSIVGQYWDDVNYVCDDFFCEPGATNTNCVTLATVGTGAGVVACVASTHTSGQCNCDIGYYPDSSGVCQPLTTGFCDKRKIPGCECLTTSLAACTCALGYYPDDSINMNFECINTCTPDNANCVTVATPIVDCTTVGGHTYAGKDCKCGNGYKPVGSGTTYTCEKVNCDWEVDHNCNKGTFINSLTYTNVHCAEGFVPDPIPINIGECTAGCTVLDDVNCKEAGTVDNPTATQCVTPPCFCALGYNPSYDAANAKITCAVADCNPLVADLGLCKCQYTTGAVSHDMLGCKCGSGYAPAKPVPDGTCSKMCDSTSDNCKADGTSTTDCTGGNCQCRNGYTSVYDEVNSVYNCEPYECDETVTGCFCSHPGDVTTCTCSGTVTIGSATVSFVGNKYAFPGYCRPLECSPSSDSNCACVDESLPETCYCKPGYSIDYKYTEIQADIAAGLDVSSYFSPTCKEINYRSSCPIGASSTPDPDTGCSCIWTDQHSNDVLCKCGIVVDEDCFNVACDSIVDINNNDFQNDGPCAVQTETVGTTNYKYSICKNGLISDLKGNCKQECGWQVNSPSVCSETDLTCAVGYEAHIDMFGNYNCYLVECEAGSTNCICESAITKLRGWDDRLCRCGPGYVPNGLGGCTDACNDDQPNCNRACTAGTCCALGYSPRATWTSDGTSTNAYKVTVSCVSSACNQAVDSNCVCASGATDEALDAGQCKCASGYVHDGKGACVVPTVATCLTCSGIGTTSECYSVEVQSSEIDATTGSVSSGIGSTFTLATCDLDADHNQEYHSCELRWVTTNGGAPVVSRGCSSNICSEASGNKTECTSTSTTETCVICCNGSANCNKFKATSAAPQTTQLQLSVALLFACIHIFQLISKIQ